MRVISLLLLIATGFGALLSTGLAYADAIVGQLAPAFSAPTLEGKNFDLSALKGKVVVLHFWATWCGPCREEMPALEAVFRKYRNQGLEVLAVSADRIRARADVDQVMHYFTFPAAMLSAVTKNDLGTVAAIPVTYVIGKDGVVDSIMTPDLRPLTESSLGDEVKTLLGANAEPKINDRMETPPPVPASPAKP